jgi:transcriptional regulator of arginine metabolism
MPGNANAVAALIDAMKWPEILGTISGDDTILIISRSRDIAPDIVERFLNFL